MAKATGIVYRSGTKEGLPQATIKASKGSNAVVATTDENGDFTIDIPDSGVWDFIAFEKESFASEITKIDLSQDQSDIKIFMDRISETSDEIAGNRLFWTLLGILAGVMVIYIVAHIFVRENLSSIIGTKVEATRNIGQQIENSLDTKADEELKNSIVDLRSSLEVALGSTSQITSLDKAYALQVVDAIQTATDSGDKDKAVALVADLENVLDPLPKFDFWSGVPLRYLEIIIWGFIGILVSKIFTIGLYLRGKRFYREGISMHIAHLAATPILVLVTVLLLSLVTFSFTLAGSNEVAIDLSDPRIMVAFAFIIGTSPWPLWNFILNTAKRFTGQLG